MAKRQVGSAKAARRKLRKRRAVIAIRAKKEFTFRGHTVEELRRMGIQEFADLCTSRVRRTIMRGFAPEQQALLRHVEQGKPEIKTHCRDMVVLPAMIGKTIKVHHGTKEWSPVTITAEMLGHYLGEFAATRHKVEHHGPGVGATRSSKFLPLK
jgi:small subunit ribosomal protein S19